MPPQNVTAKQIVWWLFVVSIVSFVASLFAIAHHSPFTCLSNNFSDRMKQPEINLKTDFMFVGQLTMTNLWQIVERTHGTHLALKSFEHISPFSHLFTFISLSLSLPWSMLSMHRCRGLSIYASQSLASILLLSHYTFWPLNCYTIANSVWFYLGNACNIKIKRINPPSRSFQFIQTIYHLFRIHFGLLI